MAGPSKRVRLNDPNYEETLQKWYQEDFSDIDDVPDDYRIESEHDTSSEQSADEAVEKDGTLQESPSAYFYGKNRYRWSSSEVRPSSKTRKHNIVIRFPTLTAKLQSLGDTEDPLSVSGLLFNEHILEHIMEWTNKKLSTMCMRYKGIFGPTDIFSDI